MNKSDALFVLAAFLIFAAVVVYVLIDSPGDREVTIGEIVDIRYTGNLNNNHEASTSFYFENGTVIPLRGLIRGVTIGDNIVLVNYGIHLGELIVNLEA